MQHEGLIYIVTNKAQPNMIKIGFTKDLPKRIREFNRYETSAEPYLAYAAYETDLNRADEILHDLIDVLNPNLRVISEFDGQRRKREFYRITPEEAYRLLECVAKISGTTDRLKRMSPEGRQTLNVSEEHTARQRRPAFSFSKCGIAPGMVLKYIRDPSIEVTVVDDKQVCYNGEPVSMSALAQQLLNAPHKPQGPDYFTYNGEKLTDLRDRLEERN